jgi:hypothetical protein
MQKTGASVALHADAYLPASDLERSKEGRILNETMNCD